jgi:hypothetical protein
MATHWRDKMKAIKANAGEAKFDSFMDKVYMLIIVIAAMLSLALAFKIGHVKGELDCQDAMTEIKSLHTKGLAMANEAHIILERNTKTVKNCLDIGKRIVKHGQEIK